MLCVPLRPGINPLRLASDYRDYFGDLHAMLAELTDPILNAGCYVARFYHAPTQAEENAGLAAGAYLEYALPITPGSFILGFLHTYTGLGSANGTDAPVGSSFRFQITDVDRNYKLFSKPTPEAWLLNDQPGSNPQSPVTGLYVQNPAVRLLAAPYPVAPPGNFTVEFWNVLNALNTNVRLTLLVAEPDPEQK